MKMKIILLAGIFLTMSWGDVFCQCPPPGLRIESAVCDTPKNLVVKTITCSNLEVKWTGTKNQSYIVKAISTDQKLNTTETEISNIFCDEFGNCSATIPVARGTNVKWSVYSTCSIEGGIFYSSKPEGKEVYIPICKEDDEVFTSNNNNDSASKIIHVYPNPSKGNLSVNYYDKMAGNIVFRVFNLEGKKVFQKIENYSTSTNSSYNLDLHRLVNGLYFLEVRNGNNVNTVKFELFRN